MESALRIAPVSRGKLWAGRIMIALVVLFFLFDGIIHVMNIAQVQETSTQLGYPVDLAVGLGILELACLLFLVIPRTAILGAILLTGYLGGAIATHVRIGSPLFSHILFPVYLGLLLWGGLYLLEPRLRELLPVRR